MSRVEIWRLKAWLPAERVVGSGLAVMRDDVGRLDGEAHDDAGGCESKNIGLHESSIAPGAARSDRGKCGDSNPERSDQERRAGRMAKAKK